MTQAYSKDHALRRRVAIGTTSNFIGQIIVFVVSFVLTPIILYYLGASVYGLWILLGSVVAYSSVLDLGIWGTIIKYVAEYQAQRNYNGARALLSTVLAFYLLVALLICLAGIIAAPYVPRLFNLDAAQHELASKLFVVISLTTGLAIPCMFPLSILRGLQRYEVVNGIDVAATLVTALASVIVLWAGGGVLGLALVNLATLSISLGAGLWSLRRLAPQLTIDLRAADWRMARQIFSFSWPLFMRDMATRLQTRTDEITIGLFLPVSAVGAYNIARRLSEATQTLTRQFMKTLLPLASQLNAEADFVRLRALYKTGTRMTIALVLALGSVLIVLAGPVLTLWVGAEYSSYAWVVTILTIAMIVATTQWPAMAVLQALSRHRILALSSLGNGIANLILSLLLVRPYGLVGVAMGTMLPTIVEYFLVVLPYSLDAIGVRLREAIGDIFVPALLPAAPTFLVLYALRGILEPASFLSIALIACAGLGVYAIAYLSMAGNQTERQWLLDTLTSGYRLISSGKMPSKRGLDG
jgi:O-antigen/teichoic acid export membrane protein